MGSYCVAQAGLEFLGLSSPPALASQCVGITSLSHHTQPRQLSLLSFKVAIPIILQPSVCENTCVPIELPILEIKDSRAFLSYLTSELFFFLKYL